jgi:NTP pyrophosphatase (non-canonical NTP hydrolase)
MNLKNEFAPIREWATDRGLYEKGNVKTQFLKLNEEIGELSRSILKDNYNEYKDAIGDIVIVLTNMAYMTETSIEECINGAYQEIKNRKGLMINGTFVKQETENQVDGQSTLKIKKPGPYVVTNISVPYDGPFSNNIITYTLERGRQIIYWHEGPNKKLDAKVGDLIENIVLNENNTVNYKESLVKIITPQIKIEL